MALVFFALFKIIIIITCLGELHTELIVSWYSSSQPAEKRSAVQIRFLEESPEILQDMKPTRQRTHRHDFNVHDPQEGNTRHSKAHKTNFIG